MQIAGRTISKYSVALLVIVLTGLFLRVYHLGAESLWADEVWTLKISELNVFGILKMATVYDVAPPLYAYFLYFWLRLFGISEFALRFLSVIFGVLAIPMIYLLGRRLFNEEVGLVSALILAISPFNVQYSQELRMYSLLSFLALLSMYFFVRFLERGSLAISVGYVLSTALMLYTHLFGLFVLIAQNIFVAGLLLWSSQSRSRLKQWLLIQAITIIVFAPWFLVLFRAVNDAVKWILGSVSQADPITLLLDLAAGIWGSYYVRVALLILFLGLSVFSLFTYRKTAQNAVKGYAWGDRKNLATVCLLLVWLFSVIGLPLLFTAFFSKTVLWARYMIAAAAPLYLLAAKGIRNVNYSYAKLATIAIIIILSAANLQTYYTTVTKDQAREATGFVNENAKNGDLVLLFSGSGNLDPVFNYYSFVAGVNVTLFPSRSTWEGLASNIKELQSDINGHNRVWLVEQAYDWQLPTLPDQTTQTFSNASYNTTYHKSYYGYDVYLFEKQA